MQGIKKETHLDSADMHFKLVLMTLQYWNNVQLAAHLNIFEQTLLVKFYDLKLLCYFNLDNNILQLPSSLNGMRWEFKRF